MPGQKKKSSLPLVISIIVGCGVLLGIVVLVGIAAAYYFVVRHQEEYQQEEQYIEFDEEDVGSTSTSRPGEAAALVAAFERRSDWHAQLESHTPDWQEVVVFMGPDPNAPSVGVVFRWNEAQGRYVFAREGPIPVDDDDDERPDIYRPGRDVALEAALVGYEDYVARIESHSSDWKDVEVWIGPPQSEYFFAIKMRWNDAGDYYDVVETLPIE